jgi:RHS repeat-associated protein
MYYDEAGGLMSMQTGIFNFLGIEPRDLVSDISYTPFGALQSETYGNGLIHSVAYNERHQPIEIRLGRPDNLESVFRIGYIYGTAHNVNGQDPEITPTHNNGNVARIKYFISGTVQYAQTFQYDAVNRLQYAVEHKNGAYNDGARAWYQTFDYDPHGNCGINIANTSDNVEAAAGALQLADFSAANNRIRRDGFVYDEAGNLIAEPGKSYVYNAENRIVTAVVAGGAMSQYIYDGNGRRVKKVVGGVATRFEYGAGGELIAERNDSNGNVIKDYLYRSGELIATSRVGNSGEYEYATADHLGSPRAWTDPNGNLIAGGRHDYLPFGEELFAGYGTRTTDQGYAASAQQDGQRKQFGSYERDSESGLDFVQARYYSSLHRRFTSTDPLYYQRTMVIDPQQFNLYAYVRNNPLKFNDPSGEKLMLGGNQDWLIANVLSPMAGGSFDDFFYVESGQVFARYDQIETATHQGPLNSGIALVLEMVESQDTYLYFAGGNNDGGAVADLFMDTRDAKGNPNDAGKNIANSFTGNNSSNQGGSQVGTTGRMLTPQPARLANGDPVFAVIAYNTNMVQTQTAVSYEYFGGFSGQISGLGQRVAPVSLFIHESSENLEFRRIGRFSISLDDYNAAHTRAQNREAVIRRELGITGGFAGGGAIKSKVTR